MNRSRSVSRGIDKRYPTREYLFCGAAFRVNFRMADLYGQSLPDPLRRPGEPLSGTMAILHNESAGRKRIW
jgi:hypothetical protein